MGLRRWSSFAGILLIAAALVHAENPLDEYQQFSASANGSPLKWNKMKIYRSGKQMRGEYVNENEIRIANEKDRNGWVIRPLNWVNKPKECQRMALLDISSYPFFAYTPDKFDVERTATEETTETIDGHSCKVQEYAVKPKEGGPPIMMTLWRAEDLKGFPVKIGVKPASRKEFAITYTDVSVGPPDPTVFKLPPLCSVKRGAARKAGGTAPKAPAAKPPAPQKP